MAVPVSGLSVVEVAKPLLGEKVPALVAAEVSRPLVPPTWPQRSRKKVDI
jgi:hypothetical protein